MFMIKNGIGDGGFAAQVRSDNKLSVHATSAAIQHINSHEKGIAYQIIGTTNLVNGVSVGVHIKNTDTEYDLVVTYIRHQIIGASGGTTFPNANNYYRIAFGRKYASGGTTAEAENVNKSSKEEASLIAYYNNPVLTGTAKEIDRWYTKENGDMCSFNKEGAVILGYNNTIELSYVGDQTSGLLYTRISFFYSKKEI